MSHKGRCFRQMRRTKARYRRRGEEYNPFPIRQKVPLALRPFLIGDGRQKSAVKDAMNIAITRYAQHQAMVGAPRRGGARGT